jgi:hypothetical protein
MSFQTYNRDIPAAPNNPSNDQPPMKVNTNSIDNLLLIDHHSFNDTLGGYHTVVHQNTQGTWNPVAQTGMPATIANINQIVALSYTPDSTVTSADTQLFTKTGNGGISQLTGYSTGSSTDGWAWSNGLLYQWGRVNSTSSGTVTFKDRVTGAIPFPRNLFNVQATGFYNSGSATPSGAAGIGIDLNGFSNTSFKWKFFTNSSSYTGFFWLAIGN